MPSFANTFSKGEIIGFILFAFFVIILLNSLQKLRVYFEEKKIVDSERSQLLAQLVPSDIQNSISEFHSDLFDGSEQSPLNYIGYRVGKTNGLTQKRRQLRLEFCFRMDIPKELPAKYRNWGRPASLLRFLRILQHLQMLADQRRSRPTYKNACADWDADAEWFHSQFFSLAHRLAKFGYRR